jgi:hypothetical protein
MSTKYTNVCLDKYLPLRMSASTNICLNKCLPQQMSASTNVCQDKYLPLWISASMNVCLNKYLPQQMSASTNVCLDKCPPLWMSASPFFILTFLALLTAILAWIINSFTVSRFLLMKNKSMNAPYVYLLELIINSFMQLGLNEASLKSASFKLNCIK